MSDDRVMRWKRENVTGLVRMPISILRSAEQFYKEIARTMRTGGCNGRRFLRFGLFGLKGRGIWSSGSPNRFRGGTVIIRRDYVTSLSFRSAEN